MPRYNSTASRGARGRLTRTPARAALGLALTLLWSLRPSLALDPERVALVEAGFIVKFPEFIEWPKGAAQEPLQICVAGPSPLVVPLRSVALHVRYAGSAPEVRQLGHSEAATGCQLLFIPGERSDDLARILADVAERPVLTVGNTPGFSERGVDINLFTEGDRVGFEVNRAALAAGSLSASFRLLEMARSINR